MSIDPQWVSAIASCITCAALAIIVWQVKVNHDRGRREMAINVLDAWGEIVSKNTFRHVGLLLALPPKDVEDIQKGRPIKVEKRLIQDHIPELISDGQVDYVDLDVQTVVAVRYTMVVTLNVVEAIALAYKHGVADRAMLDEAFYNLFIEKEFLRKCRDFIVHFGPGAWPAIDDLPKLMKPAATRRAPA